MMLHKLARARAHERASAEANASGILALETRDPTSMMTPVGMRDPLVTCNRMPLDQVQALDQRTLLATQGMPTPSVQGPPDLCIMAARGVRPGDLALSGGG